MIAFNAFLIIPFFIFSLIVILLAISTINHRYQLRKEAEGCPPPGKLIEVNNHIIHVYRDGQGEIALVFMAGHGTSNPTIDFKLLWMRLRDKYRIAVVDRAGYGWSSASSASRDLDTILEETRESLELAGEKGPYILVPHSMSGLEAIYWAQKYPNEVKAILGLDPTVPDYIEHSLELPHTAQLYFMYLVSRIGLSRFMPKSDIYKNLPLVKNKDLTAEDKEHLLVMFYRSTYTRNMLKEVLCLQNNAKKVNSSTAPVTTPMYFFISDGKEVAGTGWRESLSNYVQQVDRGKYKYIECGHYLHHEEPDTIVNEMEIYIEHIIK